ncbi:hypothetical protein V2J09_019798 [Rumex salicifolius]
MENGGLAENFGGLTMNDAKDNSLFQVMKAVEAAEATIKQQVEENNRLRTELQKKDQQLEQIKVDRSYNEHGEGAFISLKRASAADPQSTFLHNASIQESEDPAKQFHVESDSGIGRTNGSLTAPPHGQVNAESSATSFSPRRHPLDGEFESQINELGQGMMYVPESNKSSNFWKQELLQKIREQEQEIMLLKKHLTDYSIREAQIRNEKYVLEKRIAQMRMAFDQQQQDLVDASSKALSYRQDIIEENVRLTYSLQDAQQERTTFVSSLLPLLADYSLQPPVPDAQSIISYVKVLFKHLHEKLLITEAKLKESQYQLTPWRPDGNNSTLPPPSPQNFSGAALTSSKDGLELVAQTTYSSPNIAASDAPMNTDWDTGGLHGQQAGLGGPVVRSAELNDMGRYSPIASRNSAYIGDTMNRHVKFKEPVSGSDMDESDAEGRQNERDQPGNWVSGNPPYPNTVDETTSMYSQQHLQPVPEEPSSSFSEAADDDPLPAIQDLQILGEAYPGHELQACGYSVNGTTSCNFEWVRHLEDGSVNYIDGAKQPIYLVNADDVDTYLAIEVQPLDDRKRKGELVKVFANEHRKITCDAAMHDHIEKNSSSGHASYKVSLPTSYLDIWEPASLSIKREGYTIKCSGPNGLLVTEKFSHATSVAIGYLHASEFSIITPAGVQHLLRAENMPDIISSRDAIVITLRNFILKAGEKKKGKKRSLFFSK